MQATEGAVAAGSDTGCNAGCARGRCGVQVQALTSQPGTVRFQSGLLCGAKRGLTASGVHAGRGGRQC